MYALEPVDEKYRSDLSAIAECWAGAILKQDYLATILAAGLVDVEILEESMPCAKGKATVARFTIAGARPGASDLVAPAAKGRCCC